MDFEHEQRLTAVEERAKSNTHRLEEVEKRQDNLDELVSTVKVLAVREENVEKVVTEIKQDVKALSGKSGKLWDETTKALIIAVVTAIAAFLIGRLL